MNYKKLLGWGVAIYAAVFLAISGLIAYNVNTKSMAVKALTVVVVVAVAYWGGKNLKTSSAKEIIKYSVGWVIIVAILDALFTVPFTTWAHFSDLWTWLGYVLILLIPLLVAKKSQALQTSVQNPPMV